MAIRRRFAAAAESVGQSRRFVADTLDGVPAEVRDAVTLMVSELATNALIHATSDFELSIDRTGSFIRVEVSDASGESPEMQSPTSREPHGRGLRIVDELSDEWGTINAADRPGKSIWFKVGLGGATTHGVRGERSDVSLGDPASGARRQPGPHNDPLALGRSEPRPQARERARRSRVAPVWSLVGRRPGVGPVLPT